MVDLFECYDKDVKYIAPKQNKINTIHNVDTPELCQEFCAENTECKYWTFVRKKKTNKCKLLNGIQQSGFRKSKPGAVSGAMDECDYEDDYKDDPEILDPESDRELTR